MREAARKDVRLLPLALTPLLFGIQQVSEGFVWQSLGREDHGGAVAPSLVFLFFALGFWPFWIPLCAFTAEARPARRGILGLILAVSLTWAVFLYGPLLLDPGRYLAVRVVHHSIQYDYSTLPVYDHVPRTVLRVLYLATVTAPMLVGGAGNPALLRLGILLGVSTGVSALVFSYAFASVWCFFAAVISAYLCLLFRSLPLPGGGEASAPGGWQQVAGETP